jgi:hypothetical protein
MAGATEKYVMRVPTESRVGAALTVPEGVIVEAVPVPNGGTYVAPYLIDAIIGLSIVYKGFENLGGVRPREARS